MTDVTDKNIKIDEIYKPNKDSNFILNPINLNKIKFKIETEDHFERKKSILDLTSLHSEIKIESDSESINVSDSSIDELTFTCIHCSNTFLTKDDLFTHERETHLIEKKCPICFKKFTQFRSLRDHLRIHTGEKPYKCNKCSETFVYKSTLALHDAKKHIGKQLYKCSECIKTFFTERYLHKHIQFHNTTRPYLCKACGKRFKIKDGLKKHEATHTGIKRYQCDVCLVMVSTSYGLKEHKRMHSKEKPYKCETCSKKFARMSHFRSHKKIHMSNNKKYKCQLCSKAFIQSCSLKRHKVVHTGEKSFQCDICFMNFTQACSVTRHKKLHNKKT